MAKKKDEILNSEPAEVADNEALEEVPVVEETPEEIAEEATVDADETAEESCEPETNIEKVVVCDDDIDEVSEIEEILCADELDQKRKRRVAIGAGVAAAGLIVGVIAKIIRSKKRK